MRTVRVLVIGLICAALLPFTVLLRPGHAADGHEVCANSSNFMRVVAKERDKGLKLINAIRRAHDMLMKGQIPLEQYPITIAIIHDVYANPKESPDALAKIIETACLKSRGIVGI